MPELLKKSELPLGIEVHNDPLAIMPAALSQARAFKPNKVKQSPMKDNPGGAKECRFCNPEKLDGRPSFAFHLNGRVMSFPNSAPFLPGGQRVLCLSHPDKHKRYQHAHRYQFSTFDAVEFYHLTRAAVELAKGYPSSAHGKRLEDGIHFIRCVAGFNIGKMAGQSVPHFHLQYGWEIVLNPHDISTELRALYYYEMNQAKLILHSDADLYLVVPWTPKGQYHIEIHFKHKFHFSELSLNDITKITCLAMKILDFYRKARIENLNILFTSSPRNKHWEPLRIQFIPRVNMTALYEMMGVNVVDTPPDKIQAFFSTVRWSDVVKGAAKSNFDAMYRQRFASAETPKPRKRRRQPGTRPRSRKAQRMQR